MALNNNICEKYVKTHKIKDVDEIFNLIRGKDDFPDLRENYIFRGLKKDSYKLIPSSLRIKNNNKDSINTEYLLRSVSSRIEEPDADSKRDKILNDFKNAMINDYIEHSNFNFKYQFNKENMHDIGIIDKKQYLKIQMELSLLMNLEIMY
ncbi:MAG: FRG domain-containing protein [Methanobrevibacter sp.]|jgi:hypothetical protein|nr:FRG domain-containing protein [Candidatus Methanovirga australis]MDR2544068.1 FRG domain-containing protein [Candidatus Methanovirga procula]